MAPRAYWKGYLKLSLVSCSVSLYPATSTSERVRFHTLSRATGHRLRQKMVDEVTQEEVPQEERVKGYKVGGDTYVMVEDEELDQLEIESSHTIEIESFVKRDEIDERYLDSPYYLAPNDRVAQEAFAVIRDAMRDKKMAGLGRIVLYRRERLVLLEPFEQGLLATTLRYNYEVRDAQPYFEDIPKLDLPAEMKDLASHIIDTKKATFDPSKFADRYENAVVEMIQAKQGGEPIKAAKREAGPSNVVNLMDALRRSVAAESGRPAPTSRKKSSARAAPAAGKRRKLRKAG
jgi:DNA end-binding protein Ku